MVFDVAFEMRKVLKLQAEQLTNSTHTCFLNFRQQKNKTFGEKAGDKQTKLCFVLGKAEIQMASKN